MRARTKPVLALALAVTGGVAMTAFSAPPDALPTSEAPRTEKAVTKSYALVDAHGRRIGAAKWRVSAAGGNCCEVLLTSLRNGELVEFGGTYPIFSKDQGATWTEVAPLVPSTSRVPNPGPKQIAGGEGTVVQAPGGDIIGVGWDPYSGDRLQSFYYSVKDKKWYYHEAPLHEPFYDREWVAVAKGPFTIAGQTVPWVSVVVSNFHRENGSKAIALMSIDGLHYFEPTSRDAEAVANGAIKSYLPVKPDPDFDYMQEQAQTGISAVTTGLLSFDKSATCKTQTLKSDGTWACFALPNEHEFTGSVHTDSRGWLHQVTAMGEGEFEYQLSKDGGKRWTSQTFTLPGELTMDKNNSTWDFKVNGKLGLMAFAAHAKTDHSSYQDVVMTFDVRSTSPRLLRRYYVGDGNLDSSVGLDAVGTVRGDKSYRVDFTSIAILPNGRLAVSFADKTYDDPATAVLL